MRRWFNNVWRACRYEIAWVIDHPQVILLCVVLPVCWLLVLAGTFGAGGQITKIPTGFVNLDGDSAYSRDIMLRLDALSKVKMVQYDTIEQAEASLRSFKTFDYVVIPKNFARDMMNGRGATVEINVNKNSYAVATFIELDIKAALAASSKETAAARVTAARGGSIDANASLMRVRTVEAYYKGNPAFNFFSYLLPTLLPGVLALASGLVFAGVIGREWRALTMHRALEVTGGSVTALFVGKLLPWVCWFVVVALCWVAGFAGFSGNAPEGPLYIWMLIAAMLILDMAALALMFMSLGPTWLLGALMLTGVTAPAFPFTGFAYPFESMSTTVAAFGHLIPLTHFLAGQADVWAVGSPLSHLMKDLGIQLLFLVIPGTAGLSLLCVRAPKIAAAEFIERRRQKLERRKHRG
ncbi:MAG: hypothetical protein ACFWTZ_06975 [Burkholderia sp.]|jgi:ABC-type multidrug transport system permease subunit